jgi:hypothetical protein
MTQTFPSPIMNAPCMTEADAPAREHLHGLIGTAIANLIGGPDERRHLTDTISFLTARLNEAAIVTQVRVLQFHMDAAQRDIGTVQKPSASSH